MPSNTVIHLHSAIAPGAAGEAPDWVQLVPPGTFRGADGRGPYRADPAAVIAGSRPHLPAVLDEMHATDLAKASGASARAAGWIVELQDRGPGAEGGVWGRVEWTGFGRQLVADRAYRGLSPAIAVARQSGAVLAVLRASLTNDPNLPLQPILHSVEGTAMDILDYLRQLLGLEPDADDATIRATLQAMMGDRALQGRLREGLGLARDAKAGDVLTALQARLAGAGQSERQLTQLQSRLGELEAAQRRGAAEAAVDAAIRAGRAGVNAQRDRFVALHMQDPAGTVELMAAMPNLHDGGVPPRSTGAAADAALTADDQAVIALMGVDTDAYRRQRAAGTGPVEIVELRGAAPCPT